MGLNSRAVPRWTLVMVLAIAGATVVSAGPEWTERPGTIAHAKTLAGGAHVYLDAVVVEKIRAGQNPAYFVIRECFDGASRIAVLARPSPLLRRGQTLDVDGVITTSGGQRVIVDAAVWGYTDRDGNLLRYGPLIKGLQQATPWAWKTNLSTSASSVSIMTETPPSPGEPNLASPPAPNLCTSIADAKAKSDGTAVELRCRPISSTGTGYFMLGQDGSTDTLKVYAIPAVTTTDRVCRVLGTIQTEGTDRVLDVDSGPGYDPQVFEGGVQTAQAGTLAWVKTWPDGHVFASGDITGKIVTRAWPDALYMEEDGRACAIRVEKTAHGHAMGERVDVVGTLGTNANMERSISATAITSNGVGSLAPLGMNNRMLGGGDFAYVAGPPAAGQCGVTGGEGLNNIGLLVKTWGKVTSVETEGCFIDDGSAVTGGNPAGKTGIFVDWSNSAPSPSLMPSIGDTVTVTGIARCAGASAGRAVAVSTADDIISPTRAVWNSAPSTSLTAVYCVTDATGNTLFTNGWLPFPAGGLPLYVNGQEDGIPDHRLAYHFALLDSNGRQGLDTDSSGYSPHRDVCLVNDRLQTARTSAFPADWNVSLAGYYYPDLWYDNSLGFNTEQIGGYMVCVPEAMDIWTDNPEAALRTCSWSYSGSAVFDLYDTAGGKPASGHTAPNGIVLEDVNPDRRDVPAGSVLRAQLPLSIESGRSAGTGITCDPAGTIYVRNTDTNTWVSIWRSKPLTSGTDTLRFQYGTRSGDAIAAPTITDNDCYKTIGADGSVVTETVSDRNSVFYEWRVKYSEPTTSLDAAVNRTYYTWFNELMLSESDFPGGWKPSTNGSINNILIDLYLVNYQDRPYESQYTFPAHCWFSDNSVQINHASFIVSFAE